MMMRAATVCLLLLTASTAHAQDEPKVGVAMGYPESISIVWRVWDKVAFRPELLLRGGHSGRGDDGFTSSTSDSHSVGAGTSVLIDVKRWDAVRAYVSPRIMYARSKSTYETTIAYSPRGSQIPDPVTLFPHRPPTETNSYIPRTFAW